MVTIPAPGSDAEADAIIKEFAANPSKYAHDFGRCQREFRKNIRVKYQAEAAGAGVAAGTEDEARRIRLHYADNQHIAGHKYIDSVRAVRAESLKYRTAEARERYSEIRGSANGIIAGSELEATLIRVFYDENVHRFSGDYRAAQRAFRAEVNPEVIRYSASGISGLENMSMQKGSAREIGVFAHWWADRKFQPTDAQEALDAFREQSSK